MGVRHEVAAHGDVPDEVPVDVPETFGLPDAPDLRPREETIDVPLRFGGGENLLWGVAPSECGAPT